MCPHATMECSAKTYLLMWCTYVLGGQHVYLQTACPICSEENQQSALFAVRCCIPLCCKGICPASCTVYAFAEKSLARTPTRLLSKQDDWLKHEKHPTPGICSTKYVDPIRFHQCPVPLLRPCGPYLALSRHHTPILVNEGGRIDST